MLVNGRFLNGETLKTTTCIIGSGLGGGSLALELGKKKEGFILIEAGSTLKGSDIIHSQNVGLDFKLSSTNSIELGGTSNLWHGVLSMLDPMDFRKRSWIPHSGWPIQFEDLLPYYQQAANLFKIEKFDYFFLDNLPDSIKEKLEDMPFSRNFLANKTFQQPFPIMRMKDDVIRLVKKSDKFHCYYNSVALEVITSEDGTVVKKLRVGNSNGKFFNVEANNFILCAGALETPRLLLNSSKVWSNGIGNKKNLVGKFLMDHPMGNLLQVQFKEIQRSHIYSNLKYGLRTKIKSGLLLKEDMQEKLELPNHSFYMRPSFAKGINDESEKIKLALLTFRDGSVTFRDFTKVMTNLNVILQILAYRFSLKLNYRYSDLFFLTEQVPNINSCVSLSHEKDMFGYPSSRINWQLLQQDHDSMNVFYDLLRNSILSEDDYIFTHGEDDFNWSENFTSAAHHVGTTRMSDSINTGVVDKNLKVFDINNLYICDGGVFTTSGNVNSGFTISALACRLSEYLYSKEYKSG